MPNSSQRKNLRTLVILNLALLALLLVFGLAFDTKNMAGGPPSGITPAQLVTDFNQAGIASYLHMGIGIVLAVFSLANTMLALRSGWRRVQVFGTLALLFILAAGIFGLFFVASGFQATALLAGLVPFFILSVLAYLMELLFLRAPVVSQPE
jgi:hypothetical protein